MAKIPYSVVGKFVRFSYKLNPQIRIGGDPQYEMKVFVEGPWGYQDLFNNHRKENKISYPEANAIFDFMRYYGQLHQRLNMVNRMDSEGEMKISANLVYEYNQKH